LASVHEDAGRHRSPKIGDGSCQGSPVFTGREEPSLPTGREAPNSETRPVVKVF